MTPPARSSANHLLTQWSRLLSPLSSGSSRKDQAKDPAKRLHRFEKEYGNLLVSVLYRCPVACCPAACRAVPYDT